MKRTIRNGVFETNSSSTHSICIANDFDMANIETPKKIYFEFGEFGWEVRKLDTSHEKASYLYTALLELDLLDEYVPMIEQFLKQNNILCDFEEKPKKDKYGRYDYYIEHDVSDLTEFVETVCNCEGTLLLYLLSEKSFVLTGNDNCDCETDINVDYPHLEFYKGN
ncbi:MAG: hypothetical protein PHU71_04675 [Candidatus Gracilibacteria bacterium]|nr:hypothetical protein [Candidatus Gracilibacteria bacterium]